MATMVEKIANKIGVSNVRITQDKFGDRDRPVVYGSAMYLLNLLRQLSDGIITLDNGKEFDTVELKTVDQNGIRRNGTVGKNYSKLFALTQGEASELIEFCEVNGGHSQKGKKAHQNGSQRASNAYLNSSPSGDPMVQRMDRLEALVTQFVTGSDPVPPPVTTRCPMVTLIALSMPPQSKNCGMFVWVKL